ncbi:hypothetical protein, partial [Cupriavidus sp. CuC1]|uniref:hypothetical protein n=1 Tax=Cupriavidus sp. CuC1 TaxID=3373131 RepID=UPI0037CE2415
DPGSRASARGDGQKCRKSGSNCRTRVSDAAAILGMPKSHLSNILSGKKYLPFDFRIKFQALCGNWAIRQYEDAVCGFRSVAETQEQRRIRELESQIEAMKAA